MEYLGESCTGERGLQCSLEDFLSKRHIFKVTVFSEHQKEQLQNFGSKRDLMLRCLFEYKSFVSFMLINLLFCSTLTVRKNLCPECVFNAAVTGGTLHYGNYIRRNKYK